MEILLSMGYSVYSTPHINPWYQDVFTWFTITSVTYFLTYKVIITKQVEEKEN